MRLLASKVSETQLRKLHIDNVPEDYEALVLHQILEAKKDSLCSLSLGLWQFRLPPFPPMANLQTLTLRLCASSHYNDNNQDGNYMYDDDRPSCYFDWGDFPQLVTLILHDTGTMHADGFDLWELLQIDSKPCPTLKNLEIPPQLDPDMFESIARIFPNIVKLVVALQTKEKNFKYLWTSWPNLKTLVLSTFYL